MSQYGAYGAALKGLGRDSILAFYYPARRAFGDPRQLDDQCASPRSVRRHAGRPPERPHRQRRHAVDDPFRTNSDGTACLRWRVVPDGTGLTLQWFQVGTWRSVSGWSALTAPVSLSNTTTGTVRVVLPGGSQRDYRRTVRTIRSGSAAMSLSVLPGSTSTCAASSPPR